MKKYLVLIILSFAPILINAQQENDFTGLVNSDVAGGNILKTDFYDGTSLWGLIDGGADIYLEYGFIKLVFQEVEMNGFKFRCEIYKMNDDKSAFGIFSVSRYKCDKSDTLAKFICITPYQVQAPIGQYYISISNEKGNEAAERETINLFTKYLTKINQSPSVLPPFFEKKSFEPYRNQLKFMKGALGIQNGFPAWIDLFDQFSGFEIYLLPVESAGGYANIAQIKFNSENDAKKFIEGNNVGTSDQSKTIKIISPDQIIYIESNFSKEMIDKYLNNN